MDCPVCGTASGLEPLCGTHRRALATATALTPEQLRVRRPPAAASVALVDVFGVVHPLGDEAVIGRDPAASDLAIVHPSVSSKHARLTTTADALEIVDLGSLNGTFVEGVRVEKKTIPLAPTHLRFGEVSLILCPDAVPGAPARGADARRTVPSPERLDRLAVAIDGVRWELTLAADGAGLASVGARLELSSMEGRLLRLLLSRAGDDDFVPSAELVGALGFGSRAADSDNVRELVRRLRRKLDEAGLGELIESRRNAGYRVAPRVRLE